MAMIFNRALRRIVQNNLNGNEIRPRIISYGGCSGPRRHWSPDIHLTIELDTMRKLHSGSRNSIPPDDHKMQLCGHM
jgi:hypothetical protein